MDPILKKVTERLVITIVTFRSCIDLTFFNTNVYNEQLKFWATGPWSQIIGRAKLIDHRLQLTMSVEL